MQTIAVRAGQHRTDEGEHSEPILRPALMFINQPLMLRHILTVQRQETFTLVIPTQASVLLSVVSPR